MQKLFEFIIAKRHWFLFILCEIISFTLIYRNNVYQQNMMLTSANTIAGSISSVSGTVISYFDLHKVNQELLDRNAFLEMEVVSLREQLHNKEINSTSFDGIILADSVLPDSIYSKSNKWKYISAGVVNNSTTYLNNYITINKGFSDGIRPDMGIVSPQGIVGIVKTVNEHFSVVISLLNIKSRVSCKVLNTNYFGSLSWKGDDVKYAYLEQLPTHATFNVGDTIVTSGYSAVFPPGIMVGIVEMYSKQDDDNFYSLKVRLATDFNALNAINIIDYGLQSVQREIELEARKND
jgi:Cell shape-determining protein